MQGTWMVSFFRVAMSSVVALASLAAACKNDAPAPAGAGLAAAGSGSTTKGSAATAPPPAAGGSGSAAAARSAGSASGSGTAPEATAVAAPGGSVAAGSAAAAAAGEPRPFELVPITRDRWPAGVSTRGDTIERSVVFVDKNGANYLVMSSKETSDGETSGLGPKRTRYLYVDDWVVPSSGRPRSLLPVRDMVADCVMGDAAAKFHDAATVVTDLDHDGIAEIAFAYELSCRSDVRPAVYKLLLIENGAKYILRGETRIESGGGMAPPGGAFQPDPPADRWPPGFLDHARQLWDRTRDDLEIPPRPGDPK